MADSEAPKSKIIPNSFQCPNAHVDDAMRYLTGDEYKVLNFAVRHILGWQDQLEEKQGRISVSMFVNGYTSKKTGRHFGGCGLKENAVKRILKLLKLYRLLLADGTNEDGTLWKIGADPDWQNLEQRVQKKKNSNVKRTQKARQVKAQGGLSDNPGTGGVVGQPLGVVGQPQDGGSGTTPDGGLSDNLESKPSQNQYKTNNTLAPSGAPVPGNVPIEPVEEITPVEESSIEENEPETPAQPEAPEAPEQPAWIPPWDYEYPNPETGFYDCKPQNIASLIKAWWNWVPAKPLKRGKAVEENDQYAVPAYREHAENLWKRGVRPADFVECLIEMRSDSRYKDKGMTFTFVADLVDKWCADHTEDRIFTPECPRRVPRAPGLHIDIGDITSLAEGELFRRIFDHPDFITDVPPVYISAQPVVEDTDDGYDGDYELTRDDFQLMRDLGLPPL